MVRKTREGAAATREALLDAAEFVFRAKGVARATLADVAQAAGVTRGAVYWHFNDKSEILAALCERAALPMESMIACCGAAGMPALDVLRDNAAGVLVHLARDARTQAVFDVLFNKCEDTDKSAPTLERQRFSDESCRARVIGLLDRAVTEGALPPDTDVALAAAMLKAFMLGLMHVWMRDPAAYDLARQARPMVEAMIAGIAARPPRVGRTDVVPYAERLAAAS